ncbi:MAG: tetraacyldisaccharide 4'-kinase [Alphaproteobacteria bacterium]|nr:tetraacyldisaccharide 4'-kinase [Alphaproteobacteria bacterium]
MKTPKWFLKRSLTAYLLLPISGIYLFFSKLIFYIRKKHEYISKRPIICFGNILAGGVGKTPIVRNVAKFLDAPVVMRGYKKTKQTGDVGDEAKMLSSDGLQVHVGDRKSNLILLNKQRSKTPIVMDDGFQNSSIKKDISIVVFDESIGFGNGFLLPSGPLRETKSGIFRADAILVIRKPKIAKNFFLPTNIPVFYAKNKEVSPYKKEDRIVAFAGIGYPEKFFNNISANIVKKRAFSDHYQYTDNDIKDLLKLAKDNDAQLLTTEKDWVRLPEWAKKEIKFSALNTEIESSFYDWLKGKIDEHSSKKS